MTLAPIPASAVEDRVLRLSDGTELRYGIQAPEIADGDEVPLVIGLHYGWGGGSTPPAYYGRDYLNMLVRPALGDLGAVIVAPDCPARGWGDERSDAAVMELIAAIREEFPIDPQRIVVTGYSLGGMGTWTFAARHAAMLSAAIPMAGRPTPEIVESWSGLPIYAIHGPADEVVAIGPTREAITTLAARGVDAQLVEVPGLTHFQTARFARPLREAIPWLQRVWSAAADED